MPEEKPTIFISHASADTEVAKTLARFLEDRGAKVISDSNIRPSESFLDEIEQAIKTSRVVILLVSPHFLTSPWCNVEAGIALGQQQPSPDRRVVPILIGGVTPQSVSRLIWQTQAIVASGMDEQDLLKSLDPIVADLAVAKRD
jgi:hypothetical protein